jgi:predicted O-linked N-acetylglucosamine transferase (SPINDLY family)
MDALLQSALDQIHAGQIERGEATLRRVLQRQPRQAQALRTLATILAQQRRYEQAEHFFQRALAAAPTHAGLAANYGAHLMHLGRAREALAAFERAISIDPALGEGHAGRCAALCVLGDYEPAIEAGRAAVRLAPLDSAGAVNLGLALAGSGQAMEACDVFADALAVDPRNPNLISNFLGTGQYDPRATPERLAADARRWGAALEALFGPAQERPRQALGAAGERAPGPLRVGVLSSDLRAHVVAQFMTGWMGAVDGTRAGLWMYHTGLHDRVSDQLRGISAGWVDAHGLSDGELAQRIERDRLDVLLELNGHTEGSRPGVLAMRPAPAIVAYCGFPGSTGMPCVGYRLVDEQTDPPGAEAWASERLVRLGRCFLAYTPPAGPLPTTQREPAAEANTGAVTFGSFNAAPKINPPLLRLWARVLGRVPGSRLVIKNRALGAEAARARVRAVFEGAGIDPSRLSLRGWTSDTRSHLEQYREIDIALDSAPYNGTTTTCEALLMGVPVLTLAGTTHQARVGVSLLTHAGVPELIAPSEGRLEELAAALAGDPARLAGYRATLRERLLASPVCDCAAHARAMVAALEQITMQRANGG